MKKWLLFACLPFALIGCEETQGRQRDGNGTVVPYYGEVATDNKNFSVGKLFTHDGYTIYRFYDGGTAVYYAIPVAPSEQKTASTTAHWQTSRFVGVVGKGGHYVYDDHNLMTITAANEQERSTR